MRNYRHRAAGESFGARDVKEPAASSRFEVVSTSDEVLIIGAASSPLNAERAGPVSSRTLF